MKSSSKKTVLQVPFNVVHKTGKEIEYLSQTLDSGHLCGNGPMTKACMSHFQNNYGVRKGLLTSSCTDALEMAALLCDLGPGDEVIMPSYTFVSTANAFELRGVTIKFGDSAVDHPNLSMSEIERLLTPATKAVVVVHYGGVACEMDRLMELSRHHNFFVIEDAAQAIDATYKGKPLGTIGHLGTFSFHQTKNIVAGEAGLLSVNHEPFIERSEIVWEKGTDRSKFVRGEVDKYGWVDLGSSFLAPDLSAAVLLAQLEALPKIQSLRVKTWDRYFNELGFLGDAGCFRMLKPTEFGSNNAHLFGLICQTQEQRDAFIKHAQSRGVRVVAHYTTLHTSEYFAPQYSGEVLPNAINFANCLVRLPLFADISPEQTDWVIETVKRFDWDQA